MHDFLGPRPLAGSLLASCQQDLLKRSAQLGAPGRVVNDEQLQAAQGYQARVHGKSGEGPRENLTGLATHSLMAQVECELEPRFLV